MKIIGLDYGSKRLGFAVSDPSETMALVLSTVEVKGKKDAIRAVMEVCEEQEADKLIIGLPRNMDGSIGPMAEEVKSFSIELRGILKIPVENYDERLTTAMVERSLIDQDVSRARRKGVRDKLAAQAILQGYLDSENGEISC